MLGSGRLDKRIDLVEDQLDELEGKVDSIDFAVEDKAEATDYEEVVGRVDAVEDYAVEEDTRLVELIDALEERVAALEARKK
jgi:hypothetical protein